MKKISVLLITLLLVACLPAAVYAAGGVDDSAGILSSETEAALEEKINEIYSEYGYNVYILTVDSLGGKNETAISDDYYDTHAGDSDGLLLLINTEPATKGWYISTCGEAKSVFSYEKLGEIGDTLLPLMKADDYDGVAVLFADSCSETIVSHRRSSVLIKEFVAFTAAVAGAFIFTGILKSKMKLVKKQREAGKYVKEGSFELVNSREVYLYSRVTRVAKSKPSSGGGGSHRSSGGISHGGRGGRC